jgi:ATP-dependent RNA helicase RhlE
MSSSKRRDEEDSAPQGDGKAFYPEEGRKRGRKGREGGRKGREGGRKGREGGREEGEKGREGEERGTGTRSCL